MGRIAALALTFAACLFAQRTFKVDVQLVRLLATAKDQSGKPVGGLRAEDFEIRDRGVQQTITLFERQTAQPLSVALMVDTSGSTAKDLPYEIESVNRFLKALFREGDAKDAVSLYTFNWEVRQHTEYTRNVGVIHKRLKEVKAEAGTSMYDAIRLGSRDLDHVEGRKVMILITDGGDTVSNTSFHEAAEAAQRADAVVYAILVVPITNDAGRNTGGENALDSITASTGGKVFRPEQARGIDGSFDEILRDLRTQYLIGYYPKNVPVSADRFHPVKVVVKQPGLRVVTRSGYYE